MNQNSIYFQKISTKIWRKGDYRVSKYFLDRKFEFFSLFKTKWHRGLFASLWKYFYTNQNSIYFQKISTKIWRKGDYRVSKYFLDRKFEFFSLFKTKWHRGLFASLWKYFYMNQNSICFQKILTKIWRKGDYRVFKYFLDQKFEFFSLFKTKWHRGLFASLWKYFYMNQNSICFQKVTKIWRKGDYRVFKYFLDRKFEFFSLFKTKWHRGLFASLWKYFYMNQNSIYFQKILTKIWRKGDYRVSKYFLDQKFEFFSLFKTKWHRGLFASL